MVNKITLKWHFGVFLHRLLIADLNKFLLKKSVTKTHCKRLVNHWTLKIYQILNPSNFYPYILKGDWDRDKEGGEIAWIGNGGGRQVLRGDWWDGKRCLFSQIVVISRFIKNPDSYSANSLKKDT